MQCSDLEYQVKLKDLEKCFKFAVEYHLDERKGSSNRTTGQYRGLGGIIDNFFIGKLVEIGVASILEKYSQKKMNLDFKIHGINKENVTDPDIVSIEENGKKRKPKRFVEIKVISPSDRWIGLTSEQFTTILKNSIVNDKPSRVYIIFASLMSRNYDANGDVLGVYLKEKTDLKIFEEFCDSKDLYIEIQYDLNGNELENQGVKFNEGSYLYETELFEKVNEKTAEKITNGENNHIYKKKRITSNKLPIIMRNKMPKPKEFGKFFFKGDIELFLKKNQKSNRMYINCKSDVIVENDVLGCFELEKDNVYDCFFTTVGRHPTLKRNNIWIAQRNLANIVPCDLKTRLNKLSKSI